VRHSNYDKRPSVPLSGRAWRGWDSVAGQLLAGVNLSAGRKVIAIECYCGVSGADLCTALEPHMPQAQWFDAEQAMLPADAIDELVAPFLGGDDPIFGYMSNLSLEAFFDPDELAASSARVDAAEGLAVIVGTGASLVAPEANLFVYADLPRWEAQLRQRSGQIGNLGYGDMTLKPSLKYKRAFFVDWRVCDRHKRATLNRWDYLLDTTALDDPKLVDAADLRSGLAECTKRPFRVVPFFDPGPWGGQWMKEVCDLDRTQANFAWCFDCVPEENSMVLDFGGIEVEIPSLDLVFAEPRSLLGEPVYGRFGAEFPIRFDFLDTMGGGNLSLQVHPRTDYIQSHFGVPYTQDESYYLLDAKPGASVYLGRRNGVELADLVDALEAAQAGAGEFAAEDFVGKYPANKHAHFLIPAGTLHCSGADSMVLEISATPFIFTFKLWDWGRLGLDGLPRPINIARGAENIAWERDEDYAAKHLVNVVTDIGRGEGWREERTGLHEAEFIETRRHWFTGPVDHDTGGVAAGGVHVLNLVEGAEAIVESPDGAFAPFIVHYAETFIIPAAVGRHRIRPHGASQGHECATIKAFVRTRP